MPASSPEARGGDSPCTISSSRGAPSSTAPGAPARTADITVSDGVITGVGDHRGEAAVRTVDADGLLVTPGWVDIHTHYDGQATWDEVLAPSSWHGVTTLVTGNCGVGFAPARPDRHEWLIGLMEGVEDIPGSALSEGMTWDWETFPEYLDALDRRRWTVDVGTQIAHGAVRSYVMGERGARNEPATPDDIAAMKQLVKEAIAAGALGFSTSRTIAHRAIDGEPVPGTYAAEDELFGIGAALGELGTGIFELAPAGTAGEDIIAPKEEVDWMRRLSAAIQPAGDLRPGPGGRRPRPVARADGRVAAGRRRRCRPVAPGGRPGLRAAVGPLHHLLPARPDPRLPGAEGQGSRPRRTGGRPAHRRGARVHRVVGARPRHGRAHGAGLPDHVHARQPARVRARARAVADRDRRGHRAVGPVGGLRRHARGRRAGPAVRADPQLLRRRPARRPRDAPPPPGGRRAWATAGPTAA